MESSIAGKRCCSNLKVKFCIQRLYKTGKGLKEKKSGRNNLEIASPALVEVTGIEPVSKHDIRKLSTCLFPYYLSGDNRNGTNQLFP